MQKSCFLRQCSFSSNFYEKKLVLNIISLWINLQYIHKKHKKFEDWAIIQNKFLRYSKWKGSAPDVTLQKEKNNHEFTFISEEINAWNTFWNITKLTILCSEKPFSKNSIIQKPVKWFAMQNSWLVSKLTTFLVKGIFKQTLTHFQPMFHLNKPDCWFLLAKCLKKHLWRSDLYLYLKCTDIL